MRAVQWFGRGDVRFLEVEEPCPPGPGEIAVAVDWCGICGTDVEEFTDGPIVIPTEPHQLNGLSAPMILGHEVSGRIAAVGSGVDELAIDTQVALDGYIACGSCSACVRHQISRCSSWAHIGFSHPGGLAELMVVPAKMALSAPDSVSSDQLALAEPFAVAVRAVRRGRVGLGDRVAIIGGGTIGQAVLQIALSMGCDGSLLVDPLPNRRVLATKCGAEVAGSIAELIDGGLGQSFDVIFDCTGSPDVPAMAAELARSGGRVVLVGIPPKPGIIDYKELVIRELTLVGTVGHVYDEDTRAAVSLIATKRVDAQALISHRLPLERAVEDGLHFLAGPGKDDAMKMLVSPLLAPR